MPTKQQSSFPDRLRQLREAAGVSCNELGHRAGISGGMVSRLERGLRTPTLTTLRRLMAALQQKSLACWD